jgi:hypothetical protein
MQEEIIFSLVIGFNWFYLVFFGYYPILKEMLEKLYKPIAWGLKLVVFNIAVTAYGFICYFLFFGQLKALFEEVSALLGGISAGAVIVIAIYVALNLVFVVYDIALTRLITLYLVRLRKKFKFLR